MAIVLVDGEVGVVNVLAQQKSAGVVIVTEHDRLWRGLFVSCQLDRLEVSEVRELDVVLLSKSVFDRLNPIRIITIQCNLISERIRDDGKSTEIGILRIGERKDWLARRLEAVRCDVLTEPVECVHVTQNGIGHFNIPAFVAIGQVMGDARDAINAREVEAFVGVDGDGYGRLQDRRGVDVKLQVVFDGRYFLVPVDVINRTSFPLLQRTFEKI